MTAVLLTSILKNYDDLRPAPENGDRHDLFVDAEFSPNLDNHRWNIQPAPQAGSDAALASRWHKIRPHLEYPDAEYSLWIDGNIEVLSETPIGELARLYLGSADIGVFSHHSRTCVYEEAWECIRKRLDDRSKIYQQMGHYHRQGLKPNRGLSECCVILRRHSPKVADFNELWWSELSNFSHRDQLSFDYLAGQCGISLAYFPQTILYNSLFMKHEHRVSRGGRGARVNIFDQDFIGPFGFRESMFPLLENIPGILLIYKELWPGFGHRFGGGEGIGQYGLAPLAAVIFGDRLKDAAAQSFARINDQLKKHPGSGQASFYFAYTRKPAGELAQKISTGAVHDLQLQFSSAARRRS